MRYPMDSNCPDGVDPTMCASGNSWGCRRYHLDVAMSNTSSTNNVTHCPHTTPLSSPTTSLSDPNALTGTVCNSHAMLNYTAQNGLVADFCNQATSACSNFLGGLDMTKCVSFFTHVESATDVSQYPDGTNRKFPLLPTTGAGLPCRRYHIQVARTSAANAATHCPHALFGDDTCGSTCEQLCTMGAAICPNDFNSNCMSDCANKVPGPVDPTFVTITNKDIVCRVYHLSVASESAANNAGHCSHATIKSTPATCGTSGAATLSVSALFIAALTLITKFSS